ncbi:MAG: RHS repeat-associated core domain-containing protein [Nitrosomonas sp.]|nr:RHS repeat-associated core domain-containing protein [Nitrosomonas sp.]
MPIDIASGKVELDFEDISIPGKVDLIWERSYSTGLLDRTPSLLGKGWTSRYFATLTHKTEGFEFVTPQGTVEFFADFEGSVDRGSRVINFGSFLEIFKQTDRYIIQSWDVETGEIQRYCFAQGEANQPWPLASIEDVTGQALDVAWDKQGRLTGVQQRLEKRALLFGYNKSSFIEQVTFRAADGERQVLAHYDYDADGRLIAAYDAANFADRYEYDAQNRVTREIVKDGGVFIYRYDHQGRCVKSTGLGRYDEKRLRYLDAAHITELTDSYDRTFSYQYLPSGQMVREVDPLGNEKKTDYDEHGRIIVKTDATGATTRYTYDAMGNRDSVTDALGNTYRFLYNEHHLARSMTDPLGQIWWRGYDQSNRLIGTQDPLKNQWLIRYDAEGNIAEIQNPKGDRKYQKYTQGVLEAVTDWMGNIIHFRLDSLGRVIERTGVLGEKTQFQYDRLGNPIAVILPDGATLRATYDNVGNLTRFTDANGHSTYFRFGPCQRLLERIDPVGGVVRYVWGTEPGRLEQVINEKGETYTFFRNDAGRIVREQSFDGAERQFQYDAEGFATSYTNANSETIAIQRDALHRVIGQTLPDGEQVTYGFDPIGNLVKAENADIPVRFERDPLGRIIKEFQGEHWVESRYDAVGNLIHTATSLGHTVDFQVDANSFVSKLTTLGDQSLEFKRNAYGQETHRQMPGGVVMEQRYDDLGRLIEQRVGPGRLGNGESSVIPTQREIIRRSYAYDRNGSLTSIVDGHWGQVDYVYDPAERLLQVIREQGLSESFTYDATGNISRMQSQDKEVSTDEALLYGPGNRLLQKGNIRYEYDTEGRRVKKIEDANSDNPKVWLYEWNVLDRLKAVIRPNREVWRYKYDALARRVEKAGPKDLRQFLWDKDVVIHESDREKSLSTWMFDAYSFAPLATVQNRRVYPVINDHLGTPNEIIDSSGVVVWSIAQKVWGEEFSRNNDINMNTVDCSIRFQGQWYDEEVELTYNRFRYYDSTIGSFICQDPISLAGGLNLYAYVKNSILFIDPFGLAGKIDDNNFFAPSNEYGRGSGSGQVTIPYQGSRGRDFTLANKEAGFKSGTPDGYTWHHVNYDPKTGEGRMQLVKTDVHSTTPHSGGVSDFQNATKLEYDKPEAVDHVEKKGRLKGRKPCR